ncbi:hypothetical protein GCM10023143_15690 [Compostibacter hankyongensis]|uniref:4-O-methyl-glucuronoyl methylesterase-like domain-containing protein n=2 Tax=Compostibacter hankyongensis TaxID=1007089 RepID=A0ABP8FPP8_9BACT
MALIALLVFLSGAIIPQNHTLLSYIDASGRSRRIKTKAEWKIKQRQIRDSMQAVMGPLPDRSHLPPMNIQYIDSLNGGNYFRYTITFTVAEHENISAYLYVPVRPGAGDKFPAMLALHPTGPLGKKIVDGQGDLQNRAYARELAERGYVVIAPDYPDFGDLKDYDFKTDRYLSGTMKNVFDDMRCIDLLQERADVDPGRIGVIGHSLGGHSAMFVGAFDTRLKVIVSSCGWTLLHDYFNGDREAEKKYGGKLWPWAQERYMPLFRDKYDLDPDKVPFDFDEVIAAIAPRAFFSNSPLHDANFNVDGIRQGIVRVSKVYDFLHARGNLQVCYPESEHDFPTEARLQAYRFIDKILNHTAVHPSQIK